jgi:hypothetical protein
MNVVLSISFEAIKYKVFWGEVVEDFLHLSLSGLKKIKEVFEWSLFILNCVTVLFSDFSLYFLFGDFSQIVTIATCIKHLQCDRRNSFKY